MHPEYNTIARWSVCASCNCLSIIQTVAWTLSIAWALRHLATTWSRHAKLQACRRASGSPTTCCKPRHNHSYRQRFSQMIEQLSYEPGGLKFPNPDNFDLATMIGGRLGEGVAGALGVPGGVCVLSLGFFNAKVQSLAGIDATYDDILLEGYSRSWCRDGPTQVCVNMLLDFNIVCFVSGPWQN